MAYAVAITGNVASGKSTIARSWRRAGVAVLDADSLAREAVAPGSSGFEAVRREFGRPVLAADGALDRARLREIAFRDAQARARLETIVHPEVRRLLAARMGELSDRGELLVVAELPLLFEVGLEDTFDCVVLVDADPAERRRRLVELRLLRSETAGRMMDAQADPAEKRRRSDIVVENDGSLEELERAGRRTLAEIKRRADMPMRLDLHLHTWDSFDSLSDPEIVLDAALARGIGRIAVTDHNRLRVALDLAERHPSLVIAGEEVKTAEGVDVIGLYLAEEIPKGTPAREVVSRIRDQGGIPYLPHPYAPGKGGGGELAEELGPFCDVIEVINGRLRRRRYLEAAERLCRSLGKCEGAGSDAHTLGEVGGVWTEVAAHRNEPGELLDALRDGESGGRPSSRLVHLASTWAKARKALGDGPWTGEGIER